jgi:hypothetical protein
MGSTHRVQFFCGLRLFRAAYRVAPGVGYFVAATA